MNAMNTNIILFSLNFFDKKRTRQTKIYESNRD